MMYFSLRKLSAAESLIACHSVVCAAAMLKMPLHVGGVPYALPMMPIPLRRRNHAITFCHASCRRCNRPHLFDAPTRLSNSCPSRSQVDRIPQFPVAFLFFRVLMRSEYAWRRRFIGTPKRY